MSRRKRRAARLPDREASQMAKLFESAVTEMHAELLGSLDPSDRGDADPLTELREKWAKLNASALDDRITSLVGRIVGKIAKSAERVVKRVPKVRAEALIGQPNTNRIVVQTVHLIKEIGRVHFGELEKTFADPAFRALSSEGKAVILTERLGATQAKAAFWARDQVLTKHSKIVQERAQAVGLDRYEWVTSQDERVRDEHRELNGRIFRIGDPPSVGAPGEDYNCRCTMFLLAPDEGEE